MHCWLHQPLIDRRLLGRAPVVESCCHVSGANSVQQRHIRQTATHASAFRRSSRQQQLRGPCHRRHRRRVWVHSAPATTEEADSAAGEGEHDQPQPKKRRGAPPGSRSYKPDEEEGTAGKESDHEGPPFIPSDMLTDADENVDGVGTGQGFLREHVNYTPYEYIAFTDQDITHEVTVTVDAPISKVFRIWKDRANWLTWFDLIGQMASHTNNPDMISLFIFYRWGHLPWLELYVTMERTSEEQDSHIIEESIDGMDLVAGALFEEKEGGKTEVTLRLGYYMPENLQEFVGAIGLYGNVNDILKANMDKMKEFIEQVDLDELLVAREEDANFALKYQESLLQAVHEEYGTPEEIERGAAEAMQQLHERRRQRAEAAAAAGEEMEADPDYSDWDWGSQEDEDEGGAEGEGAEGAGAGEDLAGEGDAEEGAEDELLARADESWDFAADVAGSSEAEAPQPESSAEAAAEQREEPARQPEQQDDLEQLAVQQELGPPPEPSKPKKRARRKGSSKQQAEPDLQQERQQLEPEARQQESGPGREEAEAQPAQQVVEPEPAQQEPEPRQQDLESQSEPPKPKKRGRAKASGTTTSRAKGSGSTTSKAKGSGSSTISRAGRSKSSSAAQ